MSIKLNLLESSNSLIKDNESSLTKKNTFKRSQALASQSPRALSLGSILVLQSKKSKENKFTNFQNHNTINTCNLTLSDLILDLQDCLFKRVKVELDEDLDEMTFDDKKRLCNIFKLYTDVNISELSNINKAKVKDSMSCSTGFRIFLKLTKESYQIILLDPLHLAIPSKIQYKKGSRFEDYNANNLCMRNHIIMKNNELKTIYNELEKLSNAISYD
ncbi:hypothetical protein CT138_06880 [Mannheimia varigena]|uniref:hypothetical protein n=1 Tax=Mannheimia varigena TaxID=85404 RepID=UPI0003E39D54|nr:hypothetical protein [Mannheimia varigena]AHG80560.1 hypothetical protein X875_19460 [Mannheimia varigena USDA-ARS-USMARC-1388]AWW34591.1 hypothetical protein CT138_06880 [Mannheimia varigena]